MKRIYDPIHHFIEVEDRELALLDSGPLQRLRRLRQLGLAYLAFPAAEHSRFGHALGALAVGERVIATLRRNDPGYFADERDYVAQRRLLRASLLLHDVGHGPFSHACEAVLGVAHESRTRAILESPKLKVALDALDVDLRDVLTLITGQGVMRYPVLREIVSGPNLDADRMDYLLRDAYFTGVVSGRYDGDQLVAALRVLNVQGEPVLGVDGRGVVALESFVMARYMMFSTIYFHHTTRQFERILHEALHDVWPNPRELDPLAAFLAWDDLRVLESFRTTNTLAARAVRERHTLYALVAQFNAERGLQTFDACHAALLAEYGEVVWADAQEQLLHRLPLGNDSGTTVFVQTRSGIVDARSASDLIDRLGGKAYWRKLYVRRDTVNVDAARTLCANVISRIKERG